MTYIIAEIGQNHNGSKDIAIELVNAAVNAGCDAVKLTMRDLDNEMTDELKNKAYLGPNSYGKTYGEHREKLELSKKDVSEIVSYAHKKGVGVVITFCSHTLFDDEIVKESILPKVNYLKVASRDITNTPLLNRIKEEGMPTIISTGLGTSKEIEKAVELLHNIPLSILHCTSIYPTPPHEVELKKMFELRASYPEALIGFSDHTIGNQAAIVAASMGAKVIEKHITLNRRGRGSDHICSNEPEEMADLVSQIELVKLLQDTPHAFSENQKSNGVDKNRKKLMRSICSRVDIKKGDKITADKLTLMSPGDGIHPFDVDALIWRLTTMDIPANTKIELEMLK